MRMSKATKRTGRVCITWRGSLDDDIDCVLGQLGIKNFGELGGCLGLLSLSHIVGLDGLFVVLVGNGDAPKREHV